MKIGEVFDKFIVCGHRGYAAKYPENTMPGFVAAAKLGVDMIECDVVISKDGIPVLSHDYDLDRTSDGHGLLADYTLEELRQFNMAAKMWPEFGYVQISTFEELIEMMKGYPELLLNIDMKNDEGYICSKVADIVEKHGFRDRVIFNGLGGKGLASMFDRGYYVEASPDGYYGMAHFSSLISEGVHKCHALCLDANNDVDKKTVDMLKKMGVVVWAWCADDETCVNNLIDCGVTLALCNDPIPCMKVAAQRGLRN